MTASAAEIGKSTVESLTSAQLGVWVAQRLGAQSPVFNIGQYVEIRGSVNFDLLERALRQVIHETDALRICLIEDDGGPRQSIRRYLDWEPTVVDLTGEADPRGAAVAWMQSNLARPIHLTEDPLFEFAIIRLSSRRVFWYQRYHHIINDGLGGWMVTRRVAATYTSLANGEDPAENPFLPLSDLVVDERRGIADPSSSIATASIGWIISPALPNPFRLVPRSRQVPSSYPPDSESFRIADEVIARPGR